MPGILEVKSIVPVVASIRNPAVEEKIPPIANPTEVVTVGFTPLIQTGVVYENSVIDGNTTDKSKSVVAKHPVLIFINLR